MTMEELTCHECAYDQIEPEEYPCFKCKQNQVIGSKEYQDAKDYFKPKGSDEAVKHPLHYTQGSIECIDAMISAFGNGKTALWCKINAFKYLWRSDYKNGLEDLKKASWYIQKSIELIEGEYK